MTDQDPRPAAGPPDEPRNPLVKQRLAIRARWNRLTNVPEAISDRRIRKWSELVETVILSFAALITAWAGYQAGQWNSLQTAQNVQAHTLQLQAGVLDGRVGQLQLTDFSAFSNWANAYADGNTAQRRFYEAQFRDEFWPAFDAWRATDPLNNPDAPSSPFAMPEYRLQLQDEATRLSQQAQALNVSAVESGQNADSYTLSVVILAGALLLAGLASRFEWEELRAVVVIVALAILAYTIVMVIRLPVM